MIRPDEKENISGSPKLKKLLDFLIGSIGWFILDKIFIELRYILFNPAGLLVDLAPLVVLVILFVKRKYWIALGLISATVIKIVPILLYFYMGD